MQQSQDLFGHSGGQLRNLFEREKTSSIPNDNDTSYLPKQTPPPLLKATLGRLRIFTIEGSLGPELDMPSFLIHPPSIEGEKNTNMTISLGDDTSLPSTQNPLCDIAKQNPIPEETMEDRISLACHNVS